MPTAAPIAAPIASRIAWPRAVTWGAFLACSWTWCIGMFLPILLVRDLGAAGWWAFAIPNCVGAAAMGWVLRSPRAASALRQNHAAACRLFSIVTIAFHAYWLAWLGGSVLPLELLLAAILGAVGVLAGAIALRENTRWLAAILWLASASILAIVLASRPGSIATDLSQPGALPPTDILFLAPVCVFGFALCPYLDLTFLRVRRLCDGPTAPAAFTVGFLILFASMVVLTLAYAPMLEADVLSRPFLERPLWAILATIHITLQAAFTIGVHLLELATPTGATTFATPSEGRADQPDAPDQTTRKPIPLERTLLLASILLAGLLGAASQRWPSLASLQAGEIGYRVFMSFYGLVFPAYVWICIIPRRRPPAPRAALATCLIAIALAAPFYALGFLWRDSIWLAPGLLIVLLARLVPANRTPA